MNETLKSRRAAQRAFRPEAARPSFDRQAAAQQVMSKWDDVESNVLHAATMYPAPIATAGDLDAKHVGAVKSIIWNT
jgi:hypothetical protein